MVTVSMPTTMNIITGVTVFDVRIQSSIVMSTECTLSRTFTTRRAAAGLPNLPLIDKTFSAPNNNVPAIGNAGGGGRRGLGWDGLRTEVLSHAFPV